MKTKRVTNLPVVLALALGTGASCSHSEALRTPMDGEDDKRPWASPAWAEAFTEAALMETVRVFGGSPPAVPPKWPGVPFHVRLAGPGMEDLGAALEPGLKRVEGYGGLLSNESSSSPDFFPPGWAGYSTYDEPKGPWVVAFHGPGRPTDETEVTVMISVHFGFRGQHADFDVTGHRVGRGEWAVESVSVVGGHGWARYPTEHNLPRTKPGRAPRRN